MPLDTYTLKIKHILPTLLTITIASVVGFALIRWLFCIQFSIIDIREDIWEIWIPLIFPWIPNLIWLRQRLRIIDFKNQEDKIRIMFQFIAWLMIGGMLALSQSYIKTATGKLQTLTNINEIHQKQKQRYYKINSFFVSTNTGGALTDIYTSSSGSKYNRKNYLNFDIYFVVPILKNKNETINSNHKYWCAIKYHKKISDNLNNQEKDETLQIFYKECLQKIDNSDFYKIDHFERIPTSSNKLMFEKSLETSIKKPVDDSFIILEPVFETYENRNGNKFIWIFGVFGIGLSLFLLLLIWPTFNKSQYHIFLKGEKTKE